MKQLAKQIAAFKDEELALRESTEKINGAIREIQQRILQIGGDELRRQNTRVKDVQDQISAMNDMIASINGQYKTHEKSLKKSRATSDKFEAEMREIEDELAAIQADIDQKTTMAADVQDRCQQAEQLAEEKKDKLVELKAGLDAQSEALNAVREKKVNNHFYIAYFKQHQQKPAAAVQVEIENRFSDVQKKVTDLKSRIRNWTSRLKELRFTPVE